MTSPNNGTSLAVFAAGLLAGALACAGETPPVRADDTAKVLYRCAFEQGAAGWDSEKDEQYKPWSVCEHVKEGFRGSAGALKITVPNVWGSLGAFIALEYPGSGTKVTIAYKTAGCSAITGQGNAAALKKQLHGSAPGFTDGRWMIQTFEVEKWTPWSGNETGRGQQFSTLMLYADCVKGAASQLLLGYIVVWQGRDTTPPERVGGGQAAVDRAAGEVALNWAVPWDNVAVVKFEIHRGITPDFQPTVKTLLGATAEISFRDGSLNNFGTYYYKLVAEDAAGNTSPPSEPIKVTVTD